MRRRSVHIAGLAHGGQPIPNACRIGELVWSGGIAGINPSSGTIPADVSGEVDQMFSNVDSIMVEAGGSTDDIIKVSIYTPDRAVILKSLNRSWITMFPDPSSRPARHISIQPLVSELKLQCEFVAVLRGPKELT
jgi:2-iminobutanoate/2-iminopropanoate deaminase